MPTRRSVCYDDVLHSEACRGVRSSGGWSAGWLGRAVRRRTRRTVTAAVHPQCCCCCSDYIRFQSPLHGRYPRLPWSESRRTQNAVRISCRRDVCGVSETGRERRRVPAAAVAVAVAVDNQSVIDLVVVSVEFWSAQRRHWTREEGAYLTSTGRHGASCRIRTEVILPVVSTSCRCRRTTTTVLS